jgi:sugar lactone lactonase YvrE
VACSSSTPICSAGTCAAGTWSYSAQFGTFGSGDENFFGPNRIYVSADGQTAWIADTGNNRIVVWTRPDATSKTWSYHAQFGTQGSGDSYLSAPTGVVDSPDTLSVWIADTENNRIAIWTRPDATSKTWTYSTQFGTQGFGDSDVSYPNGVFISADTLTAWVADTVNNRIVIWTRPDAASKTWSYSTQFGSYGTGDTNFDTPRAVVVSPDTLTAWVTDQGNFRVVIWTRPTAASTTWTYSTQFGSQGSGDDNFGTLAGIFVAADTLTAWIADLNQNRIVIWTRPDATSKTWSYSAQFGTAGSGDDNLGGPAGVFASPDSLTAWVVDGGNDRVVIWTQS